MSKSMVTLREMCESLQISRRSIQCYEEAELLSPTGKNKYGHLLYDDGAVERAKQIRFLQQLGFKIREIRDIIDAPDDIKREAIEKGVAELGQEKCRLEGLMEEAGRVMESLCEKGGRT